MSTRGAWGIKRGHMSSGSIDIKLLDAVKTLLGDIEVYGETYQDKESLVNLEKYEDVLSGLIWELCTKLKYKNSNAYSERAIGKKIENILKNNIHITKTIET